MSNVQNDVHDIEHSSLIVPYTTEKTTIEIIDTWGWYWYYCIRSLTITMHRYIDVSLHLWLAVKTWKMWPLKIGGLCWQVEITLKCRTFCQGWPHSRPVVSQSSGLSRQVSLFRYAHLRCKNWTHHVSFRHIISVHSLHFLGLLVLLGIA